MIELTLPWPPTANTYWRHPDKGPLAGRHLISSLGRGYRVRVHEEVLDQLRRYPKLAGRLKVTYLCFPPDKRTRDLSNLLKAMDDALTHARVWEDDGQIDEFRMIRGAPEKPGRIFLVIEELTSVSASPCSSGLANHSETLSPRPETF